MMSRRTLLITGASLLIVGFLLGFIPQYLTNRSLNGQSAAARAETDSVRAQMRLDELGLLTGRIYLETNLKNYEMASKFSTRFFDGVRAEVSQTSDPARQKLLQTILTKRDTVTGGLAKGDPGTLSAVQELFQSVLELTHSEARQAGRG